MAVLTFPELIEGLDYAINFENAYAGFCLTVMERYMLIYFL